MSLHIADIASYQGPLTIPQLRAAGFGGINVKASHGLGQKSVHPDAASYVRAAREGEMQLSSFHWLTGDASGVAQADYAYRCMAVLGLNVPGVPHVVDVEADGLTAGIYQDYIARMRQLLGRPVLTYSGDWWADAHPWLKISDDSPWLWSAPNVGYVPTYPGDRSPMWDAGYGGWRGLAVMQYRVAKVAGVDVSQSAVRNTDLWKMMGGMPVSAWTAVPCLVQGRSEFNQVSPNRDKGADGTIGDTNHSSSSDHTPDEDSDILRSKDADSTNEVHALDIDSSGPWPDGKRGDIEGSWFDKKIKAIVERNKRLWFSADDKCPLQNVIWNGRIASLSWDWAWRDYTGSDPHTNHAHFSARYDTSCENDTRSWGVATEEDDVTEAEFKSWMTEWAKSSDGKAALAVAVLSYDPGKDANGNVKPGGVENIGSTAAENPTVGPNYALRQATVAAQVGYQIRDRVDAVNAAVAGVLAAVQAGATIDVPALGAAIAANLPPIEGGDGPSLAEIQSATANALREVFADAGTPDSPTA